MANSSLVRRVWNGLVAKAMEKLLLNPYLLMREGYEGGEVTPPDEYSDMGAAYSYSPWLFRAVSVIAETVASCPFEVITVDNDGIEDVVDRNDKAAVLFRHPNKYMSQYTFITSCVSYLVLSGNLYVALTPDNSGKRILELIPVRPERVTVMAGEKDSDEPVMAYKVGFRGKEVLIPPEYMVHTHTFNPTNDWYGFAPQQAAKYDIEADVAASRVNHRFFKNGATLGTVVSVPGDLTTDQQKKMRRSLELFHSGINRAHKFAVLFGGAEIKDFGRNQRDMQWTGLRQLAMQIVAIVHGVTPVFMGAENTNYAVADAQKIITIDHSILPKMRLLASEWERKILDPFFGTEYSCRWDTSQFDSLRFNETQKATTASTLVSSQIMTPNEARDRFYQLEPVPGGDILLQSQAGLFGGLMGKKPEKVDIKSEVARALDDVRVTLATVRQVEDIEREAEMKRRTELWRRFARRTGQREEIVVKRIGEWVRRERLRIERALGAKAAQKIPSVSVVIGPIENWEQELNDIMQPELRAMVNTSGQIAVADAVARAGRIGSAVSEFLVEADAVRRFLSDEELRIRTVAQTHWNELRGILDEGMTAGMATSDIARQIEERFFEPMQGYMADRLARTEIGSADSFGLLEGWKQSGVFTEKVWVSSRDDKVRDSHSALDGDSIPIDGDFLPGLGYPRDPGCGDAAQICNCRCTLRAG